MRSIGIRELRQNASRYLRDVGRGETIEVTDRGRPVARLIPVPKQRGYNALVEAGRIKPGKGRLEDLGPPLPLPPGATPPSEILARMRADER
jgi:prevent-host-death family protein